ncbi:MAG: hypothetical protein VW268_08295 [Rhodospirillaceae bacterium]
MLSNVCPNCGGGLAPWPIRPKTPRQPGVCRVNQKPSEDRRRLKYSLDEVKRFAAEVRDIPPEAR